jgi:Flp pilus assembly protein TadD
MELGEHSQAKEAYQKAIELDPYNTIARKNLALAKEVVMSKKYDVV